MFRRSSHRRNGFRKKPATQWVASTPGYSSTFITVANVNESIMLIGTQNAANYDPPSVDRFTVLRIKGQIAFQASADAVIHCGIIQESFNNVGATIPDPSLPADAASPWMWLFHGLVPIIANQLTNTYLLVDVDIRTKRVIRSNSSILLCAISTSAGVGVTPWLRTLITRMP